MYGIETWHQVYNSLNFFELDTFAPNEHWMDVFEMRLLIASRYNVILHSLTTVGSMTFFPLCSSPPPWYEHYVNGNHYVKISLAEGHPMPPIIPNWFRFKYDCATAWATSKPLEGIGGVVNNTRDNFSIPLIMQSSMSLSLSSPSPITTARSTGGGIYSPPQFFFIGNPNQLPFCGVGREPFSGYKSHNAIRFKQLLSPVFAAAFSGNEAPSKKDDIDFTWKPKTGKTRAEETTKKFTITKRSTMLVNGDYNGDFN
ncbi:hypothetical protein OSB04_011988 [Centaurea solstitialis]|uniref:Uncharacterized protein n=1 Tax=Centaurea solstitialis TaxID=347529 RepID=A0AA38WPM6_9ASTR|nr:hypothetical protein OSB04_011988 [Centaurea solstitialis]